MTCRLKLEFAPDRDTLKTAWDRCRAHLANQGLVLRRTRAVEGRRDCDSEPEKPALVP